MNSTFLWSQLPKPFFVLAPMADVTDVAFRSIVASCGAPHVWYTEFVSAHGLASPGRDRLMLDLAIGGKEDRPLVAQFFGTKPDHMYEAGKLAQELGFDGVDINMGCPDRGVMKQGAGIALCKTPGLAQDLIRALRDGAGPLPVSVKTRLGLQKTEEYSKWIGALLETRPDALIIHGRTMKEMSKVPAHWDLIARVAAMCHEQGVICIGNGDVTSHAQGLQLAQESGVDGLMVGRGIFHNPWIFNASINPATVPPQERIELLKRHITAWTTQWHPHGEHVKSFDLMKKFFKVYISNWSGSATLRASLMECRTPEEALELLTRQDSHVY